MDFDISAPYPGDKSYSYIPRFEPLSPRNDGTTGQGAGQGLASNIINWDNIIPQNQENSFFAIANRLKDLSKSLYDYRLACFSVLSLFLRETLF
ncbi:hypothetical protein ACLGBG_02780 [Helicobacter pylori]